MKLVDQAELEKEIDNCLSHTSVTEDAIRKRIDDILEYSFTGSRIFIKKCLADEASCRFHSSPHYKFSERIFDKKLLCLALNDTKSTFASLTTSRLFDKHLVSLITDFVTIRGKWKLVEYNSDPYRNIVSTELKTRFVGNENFALLFCLERKIKINGILFTEVRYKINDGYEVHVLFFEDLSLVYVRVNSFLLIKKNEYWNKYWDIINTCRDCQESIIFCL